MTIRLPKLDCSDCDDNDQEQFATGSNNIEVLQIETNNNTDNNVLSICVGEALSFATPSYYHPLVYAVLFIAPLGVILELALRIRSCWQEVNDDDASDEKFDKHYVLVMSTIQLILIIVLYMLFLPHTIQIYVNGKIAVQTMLWNYMFCNPIHVYTPNEFTFHDIIFCTRRIPFFTGIMSKHCVIVKFAHWELLLSPSDMNGFIQAVNEILVSPSQERQSLQQT